jgi:Ca-activated chloride channel family protein
MNNKGYKIHSNRDSKNNTTNNSGNSMIGSYIVIIMMISFVCIVVLTSTGTSVSSLFSFVSGQVSTAGGDYYQSNVSYSTPQNQYPPSTENLTEIENREKYQSIAENQFKTVSQEPLSTFSIDVDTASYTNIRRFLFKEGRLPPTDAVRIEEMINYFDYQYQSADQETAEPFTVTTAMTPAPWNKKHQLLRVALQGKRIPEISRPPMHVTFLIDVSGSMSSSDKLPLLKSGLKMMIKKLRPKDTVALTVYAGAAGLVLPATSGLHKELIYDAVDRLEAGGGTAGAAGIKLAYLTAGSIYNSDHINRVILATDGDFNVGTSSDSEMQKLIETKRESGVFLTVLGFGSGNLQDAKMEKIANHGNGNYYYIDSAIEAQRVLVKELGSTMHTIAKDVKLQVEFNANQVFAYRLIGYENRVLAARDFNDDLKDAGELGAGHSVTALYELILAGTGNSLPGTDPLKYQINTTPPNTGNSSDVCYVKMRWKNPTQSESQLMTHIHKIENQTSDNQDKNFRLAQAVCLFGMLLKKSEFAKNCSFDDVISLALTNQTESNSQERQEFLQMVKLAKDISPTNTKRSN